MNDEKRQEIALKAMEAGPGEWAKIRTAMELTEEAIKDEPDTSDVNIEYIKAIEKITIILHGLEKRLKEARNAS